MKVNKKQFLRATFLLAFIPPLLSATLTGCDQFWTNSTPLMCGSNLTSNQNDPFYHFRNNSQICDKDNQPFTYLPSNYAFLRSKDNKLTSYYGYTAPVSNWLDKEKSKKKAWKDYDTNALGWYQIKDRKEDNKEFVFNDKSNDGQEFTNYYNREISKCIPIVGSIAQSLSLMIDSALAYQQSFIDKADKDNYQTIANAWGKLSGFSLDCGLDGSQEKSNFYEFLFANTNFHVVGKSNAFFKTVATNFNFAQKYFPFATYTNNLFNDEFKKVLEGRTFDSLELLNAKNAHWANKTTAEQENFVDNIGQKHLKVTKNTYQYNNVPIIVEPISLTKTYLDPAKSSSFLVSEFYQNDSNAIKAAIGNSWQSAGINDFIKSSSQPIIGPTYKSFNLKMDTTNPCKLSFKYLDSRLPNTINSNCFIALFNYNIDEYLDHDVVIEHSCDESLVNFFPAYFLSEYNADIFTTIPETNTYVIDSGKVNQHLGDLANLHNRKSVDGQQLNSKDVSDKSLLSFLGYLFGQDNKIIKIKEVLQPFEKI